MLIQVAFSFAPEDFIQESKRLLGNNYLEDKYETMECIRGYMDSDPRITLEINASNDSPLDEIIIKGIRALANVFPTKTLLEYVNVLEKNNNMLLGGIFHIHNMDDKIVWICGHSDNE
jgi:hypothetical protein